MHVVARVADERYALVVARQVAVAGEQLRRVVTRVHVRRARRAAAVERLEIRARRPHVAERFEVGVRAKRGAVGGQVVRDVLAEERPAGLDARVALAVAAVAQPAGGADAVQERLVGLERGEVEHAPVPPALAERSVHAPGCEAVVPDRRRRRDRHRVSVVPSSRSTLAPWARV